MDTSNGLMSLKRALELANTNILPKNADAQQAIAGVTNPTGHNVTLEGSEGNHVNLDLGVNLQMKNRYIQFDISNTGLANIGLIIGSVLALKDQYLAFGLTKSACDDANVKDQTGFGQVPAVQKFSEIVNLRPVVIDQIQVISSDPTQLFAQTFYNSIALDLTIDQSKINTANIVRRSDNSNTDILLEGAWLLEPLKYLQFTSLAGKDMSIILRVAMFQSVSGMTQYNG